jgi:hypothetical protein
MQRTTHRPQLGIHMHQQHQQQQQHAIPTHPPASAVTPPPLPKAPKTTRAPAAPESGSSKWTFLIIFLLGTAVGFACPDRRAVQLAQHSH